MRGNRSGFGKNLTTFDLVLIDTTEQQTNVISGFTGIEEFAEHFNAGNHRFFLLSTQTYDFNLFTNLNNTGFDTTGSYGTTTGNREYILNRHKEGLLIFTGRNGNVAVNSIHQLHNLVFPLGFAIKTTQSRTTDNGNIVAVIFVEAEQFAHLHFYEI